MTTPGDTFRSALVKAVSRRRGLIERGETQAFRVFSGEADGVEGVYIDVYGEGATLIVYEGRTPRGFEALLESGAAAGAVLEALAPMGVKAVYLKPFARDRSKMGGELPEVVTRATPAAGEQLAESMVLRELGWKLEVRLYDGLSTGLFLDQRANRGFVAEWVKKRVAAGKGAGAGSAPPSVLNTFAYTCAFSVAAAIGGAATTSVDVSDRYLQWGKRNFAHNGLDVTPPSSHRFAKMDTFEFFGYAQRKGFRYDLIILDPPSFSAGSKKKKIPAWSSVADYARLVKEAAGLLAPKGVVLASTNTQELCRAGRLEREIVKGLGREPKWIALPPVPADFAGERERFAARAFKV